MDADTPKGGGEGDFLSDHCCRFSKSFLGYKTDITRYIYASRAGIDTGNESFFTLSKYNITIYQGAGGAEFNAGATEPATRFTEGTAPGTYNNLAIVANNANRAHSSDLLANPHAASTTNA